MIYNEKLKENPDEYDNYRDHLMEEEYRKEHKDDNKINIKEIQEILTKNSKF